MAKAMGPRFKLCRSLGLNVVGHPKAMGRYKTWDARNDQKISKYGEQLLEKQRLKAYCGVMEKQMSRYVKNTFKSRDMPGDALIKSLENTSGQSGVSLRVCSDFEAGTPDGSA